MLEGTFLGTIMAHHVTEADLADLLRAALAIADDLGLWGIGARLDQALVDLTGAGVDLADESSTTLAEATR